MRRPSFAPVALFIALSLSYSCGGGGTPSGSTSLRPRSLAIATATVPGATLNQAYSFTFQAVGGTAPYTWSASTALPGGLALAASGALTGTPSAAGAFTIGIGVQDNVGHTAAASFNMTVSSTTLQLTTSTLVGGTVGVAYSDTLAASGGSPPYTFALVTPSTLPAGLSLATSGAVTGTPTTAGSVNFSVEVTDSATATSQASLSITISVPGALTVTTASLPAGTVGVAYSTTLAATGGTAPYTWSIQPGPLMPPGLGLNATTGEISGTPTTATSRTFVFIATDSATTPATASSAALTLAVNAASSGANTWTDLASPQLPFGLSSFASAEVGGVIYTFGGTELLPQPGASPVYPQGTDTIYRYDTNAATPTIVSETAAVFPYPFGSTIASGVQLNAACTVTTTGKIYIFGGTDDTYDVQYADAYEFVPSSHTLTQLTSAMPKTIDSASAAWTAADPDHIFVFGGSFQDPTSFIFTSQNAIYRYTISTDTWTTLAVTLPAAMQWSLAVTMNGKIFLFGGADVTTDPSNFALTINTIYDTILEFDPKATPTPTVTTLTTRLPSATCAVAGDAIGSKIYLCGGDRDSGTNGMFTTIPGAYCSLSQDTWVFDPTPATPTITTLAQFQTNLSGVGALGGRCFAGAAAGAGGRLYMLGGLALPSPGAPCPQTGQSVLPVVATYQP